MTEAKTTAEWNVELPWSDGTMSAKLWIKGKRIVVGVPELDILCTGKTQSEAVFRLFTTLLKYYKDLKAVPKLDERQQEHMRLLTVWVESVQRKMTLRELTVVR
jgi:hypothetical protein